jgi:hypothetical protein
MNKNILFLLIILGASLSLRISADKYTIHNETDYDVVVEAQYRDANKNPQIATKLVKKQTAKKVSAGIFNLPQVDCFVIKYNNVVALQIGLDTSQAKTKASLKKSAEDLKTGVYIIKNQVVRAQISITESVLSDMSKLLLSKFEEIGEKREFTIKSIPRLAFFAQ